MPVRMLMLLNHVAAFALLISYLAAYVSPQKLWLIAFMGLTYPLWVIINVLFVLIWFVLDYRRSFYSVIVILCGWAQMTAFVQFSGDEVSGNNDAIKVMSYNVKLFDLYNWNNNTKTRNYFFDLIKQESPDIICFQEFYTSESNNIYHLNNLDTLLKFQKAKNVFTQYTVTLRNTDHWGGAIFTVYPILKKDSIYFEEQTNNFCMYCDLLIDNDTVRVYNMHLQSIQFKKDDYKFLDDLSENKDTEEVQKSKNILRRLKSAYIKRALQADMVAAHIAASPYPVIVCGDFNDTPSSYVYHMVSQNLTDGFIEAGKGMGRTYVGKFPSFRIDYILYSHHFKAQQFYTIEKQLSDHYPVCCYLAKQP